jgi:MoxR-like ATPase
MSGEEVVSIQNKVDEVKINDDLVDYMIAIATATRQAEDLQVGVSPRGALALAQAARATALLDHRDYCIPEDVVSNVLPVCAHRVVSRTYMHDGDTNATRRIMQQVLETVPSPA